MVKKRKVAERQKLDRQAEAWFDRTDDTSPFNAFPEQEEKQAIGQEMLREIRRGIQHRKFQTGFLIKAAAAIFIVCSIGLSTFFLTRSTVENAAQTTWTTYQAGKGEFKNILLPDCSIVYLRPATRVEVPSPFIRGTRNIRLVEGEAFFDVKHDPEHPFLVNASRITTRVLGTTFMVSNYPGLEDIRVKLLTGKVTVSTGESLLGTLQPNQQISNHKTSGKVVLSRIDAAQELAWRQGEYVLNNVPMQELAIALGNIYGIDVRFESNKLAKLHITLQFNKNDQLTDILEQLKLIHGMDYRIKEKEVILMK